MKVPAFLQARMSSSRLPGKVLRQLGSKPLIAYQLERLRRSRHLSGVIVLTSREPSDDPLAEFCQREGFECFRGDLRNVSRRFYDAVQFYRPDYFARVCADSPFYDPELLDQALGKIQDGQWDLVTNKLNATFPAGQSVEVVRSEVFTSSFPSFSSERQLEHVTPYFYENARQFRIFNMENPGRNFQYVNLCVDTAEDFERFVWIQNNIEARAGGSGWEDLCALFDKYQVLHHPGDSK